MSDIERPNMTPDRLAVWRANALRDEASGETFQAHPSAIVSLLDAIEEAEAECARLRSYDGFAAAVEAEAKRYHEAECFYRIERNAARVESTRLTALLHAKEAWIEGAKVDLDGYDAARVALDRLTDPDDALVEAVAMAVVGAIDDVEASHQVHRCPMCQSAMSRAAIAALACEVTR